ncbi:NADH-quinone oxidoreductase subunit N [Nibricoccus sp. IMCC34717]|uniref:NADH-quinone oxidoreductase subunit N n=1 Tax=Nibricoccus sp. IMCC34717 TaxID=3034021 RepID=UPI00385124C2
MSSFFPEIGYALCALAAIGLDLAFGRGAGLDKRAALALSIGRLGAAFALGASLVRGQPDAATAAFFTFDALATANRVGVALLLWLALENSASQRTHAKPAEAIALALFGACGLSLLGAAQHLLSGFLSLELAGLSLYAFVGIDRRRPQAAEAALKYFLFGGLAAAFLLFGFSYLFGLSGSFAFAEIQRALGMTTGLGLAQLAVVFVIVGVSYKLAAAPFHSWAPDVYEAGHALPVSLVASASKVAGLAFFIRLFTGALEPVSGGRVLGWVVGIGVVAGFSLVLGNVVALAQQNLRRLLAYSAIGHAGALLLGLIVARTAGPGPALYYAVTYGLATVVLFGCVGALEDQAGEPLTLGNLAGTSKRAPFASLCMGVALLSLAGIPPLAGFFGKFFVFVAAFRVAGVASVPGVLACLAIAMSAVGLFYYLRVLKEMWVSEASAEVKPAAPFATTTRFSLAFATTLLVVLGLFPSLVLGLFR